MFDTRYMLSAMVEGRESSAMFGETVYSLQDVYSLDADLEKSRGEMNCFTRSVTASSEFPLACFQKNSELTGITRKIRNARTGEAPAGLSVKC